MSSLVIFIVAVAALATGAVLGALVAQLRAVWRIEALRIELAAAQVRLESSVLQDADRLKLLEQSETRLRAAESRIANELGVEKRRIGNTRALERGAHLAVGD